MQAALFALVVSLASRQSTDARQVIFVAPSSLSVERAKEVMGSVARMDPGESTEFARRSGLEIAIEGDTTYLFDPEAISISAQRRLDDVLRGIEQSLDASEFLRSTALLSLPPALRDAIRMRIVYHVGRLYSDLQEVNLRVRVSPGLYVVLQSSGKRIEVPLYFESGDVEPTVVKKSKGSEEGELPPLGPLTRVVVPTDISVHYWFPSISPATLDRMARAFEIAAALCRKERVKSFELVDRVWSRFVQANSGSTANLREAKTWRDVPVPFQHQIESSVSASSARFGFDSVSEVRPFLEGATIVRQDRILGVTVRFKDADTGQIQGMTLQVWLDGN